MEALRCRQSATAIVITVLLLGGLAACGGGTAPESPPPSRPSAERSPDGASRTTADRTTDPTRTAVAKTAATAERTTADANHGAGDPTTAPTAVAKSEAPETTKPTSPAPASSPTTAPVADEDGGLGPGGWLLLTVIGMCTVAVVLLLVSQGHRTTSWDGTAGSLAGETRTVLTVGLPPVLNATDPARRGLVWPSIRSDLTTLETRWADLMRAAADIERQTYAGQVSAMLRDLVDAVEVENQAIAGGQDWRPLRPRLEAIAAALTAAVDQMRAPAGSSI